jgi:hypothetical protein
MEAAFLSFVVGARSARMLVLGGNGSPKANKKLDKD